jgi:hypothetical protein
MDILTTNREKIIESIQTLPDESLTKLINFVDYLRYKVTEKQPQETSSSFLVSVAGLDASIEMNI